MNHFKKNKMTPLKPLVSYYKNYFNQPLALIHSTYVRPICPFPDLGSTRFIHDKNWLYWNLSVSCYQNIFYEPPALLSCMINLHTLAPADLLMITIILRGKHNRLAFIIKTTLDEPPALFNEAYFLMKFSSPK
jgi:hypothetical protein